MCKYIKNVKVSICMFRVLEGRVFTNGPGDLGSVVSRLIPKTLKWYLITPSLTLINIRYVS